MKVIDVSHLPFGRTVSLSEIMKHGVFGINYFGKPEDGIEKYELLSPYIYTKNSTENLRFLKDLRLRMYTEPDTLWWKQNRMNEYEDMNAFYIKGWQ